MAEKKAFDDSYILPEQPKGTKGVICVVGLARFYEGLTEAKLYELGFEPNNKETNAGGLLSTRENPNLRGGTPAIYHTLIVAWDDTGKADGDADTQLLLDWTGPLPFPLGMVLPYGLAAH